MKAHPDRGGSDAAQKTVNVAYDILKDPIARYAHDVYWKSKAGYYKKTEFSHSKSQTNKQKSQSYSSRESVREGQKQKFSEDKNYEPLSGLKERLYNEIELQKNQIRQELNNRAISKKQDFNDLFSSGKARLQNYFLCMVIISAAAHALSLPLLFLFSGFFFLLLLAGLGGIKIQAKRFSIFDIRVYQKIDAYAYEFAKVSCDSEINSLDSNWQSLALVSELLMRSSGFDDSEEQVARRITATLFLMGYKPSYYFQEDRTLIFSDGEEKLFVRYRHRTGQATNINYVKTLYSKMRFSGATKGLLFCSPGLSDNAAVYAKQSGITCYSLETMNDWINSVLKSDYSGPTGDLLDNINHLMGFIKRLSVPLQYRRTSYRRRSRKRHFSFASF